jgi:hypothetical protein
MDVDLHPFSVYVGYLQIKALLQPRSAGVDRGEQNLVVESAYLVYDGVNLGFRENAGQPFFFLRAIES